MNLSTNELLYMLDNLNRIDNEVLKMRDKIFHALGHSNDEILREIKRTSGTVSACVFMRKNDARAKDWSLTQLKEFVDTL